MSDGSQKRPHPYSLPEVFIWPRLLKSSSGQNFRINVLESGAMLNRFSPSAVYRNGGCEKSAGSDVFNSLGSLRHAPSRHLPRAGGPSVTAAPVWPAMVDGPSQFRNYDLARAGPPR